MNTPSTHPADPSKSGAEIDMTTLQLAEALRLARQTLIDNGISEKAMAVAYASEALAAQQPTKDTP